MRNKKFLSTSFFTYLILFFNNAAFAKGDVGDPDFGEPFGINISVNSNWVWRGLTQTDYKPAIQGGFDYIHESGFYIGNWNSNTSWVSDGGYARSAPIEMDFYGGLKKEWIGKGFATDIGYVEYTYPTSGINPGFINPNTGEVYIAQEFTYGRVNGSAKFSYAVSNTFGIANSVGSYYPELNVNYQINFWDLILNGHIGYQKINGQYYEEGQPSYSYADWLLGISKDFGYGLFATVAYVGTNVKKGSGAFANTYAYVNSTGGNAGRNTGYISLTKNF